MDRRAFTLLEVLLVIALLGLIALFAFPDLGAEARRRSLVESADRLRSLIVMTHAQAMQDGIEYRIQFPGTPDPLDRHARKRIDVPIETLQPVVLRQGDPLSNPSWFTEFEASWKNQRILQGGTRCVAVLPGRPRFDISSNSPIAGPAVGEDEEAEFVPLTLKPDGSSDWVMFVLTDLPYHVELEEHHVGNILNVIVDGRTGQTWIQRALRSEEVELMQEKRASPVLHIDFTDSSLITEDNILHIHVRQTGAPGGS
jgi:prepilin-type N-terminal cleavage/methylation domain-containing protein